jgi:hypothetical protein
MHGNARPDELHDSERPCPGNEPVAARQDTAQREGKNEASVARLERVHRHHEGQDADAIDRDGHGRSGAHLAGLLPVRRSGVPQLLRLTLEVGVAAARRDGHEGYDRLEDVPLDEVERWCAGRPVLGGPASAAHGARGLGVRDRSRPASGSRPGTGPARDPELARPRLAKPGAGDP